MIFMHVLKLLASREDGKASKNEAPQLKLERCSELFDIRNRSQA